jgi:hypothetical protein
VLQAAKNGSYHDEDGPEEATDGAHHQLPCIHASGTVKRTSFADPGSRTYRAHAFLAASLAALDIRLHSLAQLFQQESAFQPHFHDRAVKAYSSDPGFFVGGFDFE